MGHVVVRAPGKVNLHLAVGGVRMDGFHDVATVYQAVGIYDDVVAATSGDGVTVAVEGAEAGSVPTDDSNLAVRAARLLARQCGVPANVHLTIRKGIPVAGGMAGGSADAAAALVACDALWGAESARDDLLAIGAQIGSDVPFAMVGGTAMGHGRGERLSPVLGRGRFSWVMALADVGLSTPAVYAEIDRLRGERILPEPRVSDELMSALRSGDARAVGAALENDLAAAACSLRPQLHAVLDAGRAAGALGAVVSGSGPTCAFLVADDDDSATVAEELLNSEHVRDVLRVSGPVHGARIIESSGV